LEKWEKLGQWSSLHISAAESFQHDQHQNCDLRIGAFDMEHSWLCAVPQNITVLASAGEQSMAGMLTGLWKQYAQW